MPNSAYLTDLSHLELITRLDYDPDTGIFKWKIVKSNLIKNRVGLEAGCIARKPRTSYRVICLNKTTFLAHRLAWFYVSGAWPAKEIDHINGDGLDNRIINLREANRAQNSRNRKTRVGYTTKGVSRSGRKWQATIRKSGKIYYLGLFANKKQAQAAYNEAAKKLYGEFAKEV